MSEKPKTQISPDEAHAEPTSMRAALPGALALLARIGWDRAGTPGYLDESDLLESILQDLLRITPEALA
jgi:hypothetical protein